MDEADGSVERRRSKSALRKLSRQRRAARTPRATAEADAHRTQTLVGRIAELSGGDPWVVAAYWSSPEEPGTHDLVTWLRDVGHRVLLPIVSTGREHPAWGWFTTEDDLVTAPMGLAQPPGAPVPTADVAGVDLVICPGLLGGRDGSRLGTGGGWYDRGLLAVPRHAPRWLLLFSDEVVDAVPTEPHDLSVDDLISESGWVHCTPHQEP